LRLLSYYLVPLLLLLLFTPAIVVIGKNVPGYVFVAGQDGYHTSGSPSLVVTWRAILQRVTPVAAERGRERLVAR